MSKKQAAQNKAIQNAAKRRVVAMEFNPKAKLNTKHVRDMRPGTLNSLLIPKGNKWSQNNGLADYRRRGKKFRRNDQA